MFVSLTWNPTYENTRTVEFWGRVIEYIPSPFVVLETVVPLTVTVALDKGLESASVTFPVIVLWANTKSEKKSKNEKENKYLNSFA
jgi:hypothetical protein